MEKLPQHILFVLFYRKTDCILKEQIVQYSIVCGGNGIKK